MPKHVAKTSEQYRIRLVTDALKNLVTAADARAELEAEEWDVADAIFNLRERLAEAEALVSEGLKQAATAFRLDPANRNSLAIFQSPSLLRELGYI